MGQARVGQSHGAERQKCQQAIRAHRNTPLRLVILYALLEIPENRIIPELDERQIPAVWLEAVQRENQLLKVAVNQIQRKDAGAADEKLTLSIVLVQITAVNSQFVGRLGVGRRFHFGRQFVVVGGGAIVDGQNGLSVRVAHAGVAPCRPAELSPNKCPGILYAEENTINLLKI